MFAVSPQGSPQTPHNRRQTLLENAAHHWVEKKDTRQVKSILDCGHGLTEVQCEQLEEDDPLMDFYEVPGRRRARVLLAAREKTGWMILFFWGGIQEALSYRVDWQLRELLWWVLEIPLTSLQ